MLGFGMGASFGDYDQDGHQDARRGLADDEAGNGDGDQHQVHGVAQGPTRHVPIARRRLGRDLVWTECGAALLDLCAPEPGVGVDLLLCGHLDRRQRPRRLGKQLGDALGPALGDTLGNALGDVLAAGDGASINDESRLELRATEEAEFLLFDLA